METQKKAPRRRAERRTVVCAVNSAETLTLDFGAELNTAPMREIPDPALKGGGERAQTQTSAAAPTQANPDLLELARQHTALALETLAELARSAPPTTA